MNHYFLASAVLILVAGAIHSGLGESLILSRLDRRSLPVTPFGGQAMTFQLLHGTWHLLTVVWLMLAAALAYGATRPTDPRGTGVALVTGAIFGLMGAGIVANNPRMLLRHPAALLFLAIAATAWAGCR